MEKIHLVQLTTKESSVSLENKSCASTETRERHKIGSFKSKFNLSSLVMADWRLKE